MALEKLAAAAARRLAFHEKKPYPLSERRHFPPNRARHFSARTCFFNPLPCTTPRLCEAALRREKTGRVGKDLILGAFLVLWTMNKKEKKNTNAIVQPKLPPLGPFSLENDVCCWLCGEREREKKNQKVTRSIWVSHNERQEGSKQQCHPMNERTVCWQRIGYFRSWDKGIWKKKTSQELWK